MFKVMDSAVIDEAAARFRVRVYIDAVNVGIEKELLPHEQALARCDANLCHISNS